MGKIEEMAKQYAENFVGIRSVGGYDMLYRKGLDVFDGYDIENAYSDGANAVLKQIETRIAMGKYSSIQTSSLILDLVEMTIKELKGE